MKIANKKVTAEMLVRDALEKAKHFEDYNIFTFLNEEGAIKKAYGLVSKIKFDNAYYRNDIGQRALKAIK